MPRRHGVLIWSIGVWRQLRPLRALPAWGLHQLREHCDPGCHGRWRVRRLHDLRRLGACPDPGRRAPGGGRAADVRGGHHLQRAAAQRRAIGGTRGDPRRRRARASRHPVRGAAGLRDGGDRARDRQGVAGGQARRPLLHRQHRAGRGAGAPEARRRIGDPRHCHQRAGHERCDRRSGAARQADRDRCLRGPDRGSADGADPGQHVGPGPRLRHGGQGSASADRLRVL